MIKINEAKKIVLSDMSRPVVDEAKFDELLIKLGRAANIFVVGHGRSGLVAKMFANRLLQLGLSVHAIDEITCPPVKKTDLLLILSGSGSSLALVDAAEIALNEKAEVALITAEDVSRLTAVIKTVIVLRADTKHSTHKVSKQPMGAMFEQSSFLLLEACVLCLQERLARDEVFMENHHANIE